MFKFWLKEAKETFMIETHQRWWWLIIAWLPHTWEVINYESLIIFLVFSYHDDDDDDEKCIEKKNKLRILLLTSNITQHMWYMHWVIASAEPLNVTARSVEFGNISLATCIEHPVTSLISLILAPPLPEKRLIVILLPLCKWRRLVLNNNRVCKIGREVITKHE